MGASQGEPRRGRFVAATDAHLQFTANWDEDEMTFKFKRDQRLGAVFRVCAGRWGEDVSAMR